VGGSLCQDSHELQCYILEAPRQRSLRLRESIIDTDLISYAPHAREMKFAYQAGSENDWGRISIRQGFGVVHSLSLLIKF
jgi:hypothetical protein